MAGLCNRWGVCAPGAGCAVWVDGLNSTSRHNVFLSLPLHLYSYQASSSHVSLEVLTELIPLFWGPQQDFLSHSDGEQVCMATPQMNYALRHQLKLSGLVPFQYLSPITASAPSSLPWGLFMVPRTNSQQGTKGDSSTSLQPRELNSRVGMRTHLLTATARQQRLSHHE